jgi:hypothetical protein
MCGRVVPIASKNEYKGNAFASIQSMRSYARNKMATVHVDKNASAHISPTVVDKM